MSVLFPQLSKYDDNPALTTDKLTENEVQENTDDINKKNNEHPAPARQRTNVS